MKFKNQCHVIIKILFKVRLWVLRRDQNLTHLCVDISLIPKHILDHDISLKGWDPGLSIGSSCPLLF